MPDTRYGTLLPDKPRYVKAVRRGLRHHGWRTLTNPFVGVDLFVRKLDAGHRLVICLREWREATPTRLADISEVTRLATVPIICVFPLPVPEVIAARLFERRLVVVTIDALNTV